MKLIIGILALTQGFFIFSEGVIYDDPSIYKVKVVDSIHHERPRGQTTFEVEENQIDVGKLSEAVRMNMCRRAAEKVVTSENIPVTVMSNKPGRKHTYNLKTGESDTVKLVDAFKCPTKPAMYLQVIVNESGEENVIVMVQSKRKRVVNISLEHVRYKLKVVNDISEVSESEINSFASEDDVVDEDALREDERLQMCEDAIRTFPEEDIRYLKNRRIRGIKFYSLDIEGGNPNADFEVVQAFRCPTSPTTFVSVPKKLGENLEARLIIEERERNKTRSEPIKNNPAAPKSPQMKEIIYEYEMKPVVNIIDVTMGSMGEARITKVIRSAVDLNGLDEEKREEMCRRAFRNVERDYRFVRYFPEVGAEPSKYYALHSNIGDRTINIEIVEALKCPAKPAVYIHVTELKRNEGLVWVIIKDKKIDPFSRNSVYNIQPVENIEKASTRDIVQKLSTSKESSMMDTDDLTEDERHEMCRRAIKNISSREVEYSEGRTGMSKLYTVKMTGSKKEGETDESDTKTELLRAFECPAEPKIYLEVELDWNFERCTVQIVIIKSDLEGQCDDSCYQIKLVNKITERSEYKGNTVFHIPQTEVVDIDQIENDKRMEMCKKAVKIDAIKDTSFKFLPKTDPGSKKSYVLELKGAARRATPERVEAFKCPCKPPVYLQVVKTENEKEMVWVIFNDTPDDDGQFDIDENDPRYAFCKRALQGGSAGESQQGGTKSKYYLFGMEVAGTGVDNVPGKDVIKKFLRQPKSSLELEIHRSDDEEDDDYIPRTRPTWRPRGFAGPKIRGINYKKKYVNKVTEASSRNKTKYKEEFSRTDRHKLCQKALKRVLGNQIEFLENRPVGKTMTYKLSFYGRRPEYVQAFQCSTDPPIFLEVLDDAYEDIIYIILERDNDVDDYRYDDDDDYDDHSAVPATFHDDLQYEIKYITEIREATRREITAFERKENVRLIYKEEFTEEQRFQMCKTAVKEVPGKPIKFMDLLAGDSRYYSIRREDPETRKESEALEVVVAFECPTRPQIHLQLDEENENTISIILKRVPPIRDGIRSYKLKGVKDVKNVSDQDNVAYEVQSLLALEDLEYDEEMRRKMCVRAAKYIPNARGFLKWLDEDPGEENFWAVTIQEKRSIIREVVSAFECPTDPPFYLQTYVDRYFRRSVYVIVDEDQFTFLDEE